MDFINQMNPWFDKNEADALYNYMNSGGWVTEFNKTREFEAIIAMF
jgi:perosamine synthetase